MKGHRNAIVLCVASLFVSGVAVFWPRDGKEQKSAEEARRVLRQQGFKTELAELMLELDSESAARASVLANAGRVGRFMLERGTLPLMKPIGIDTARVAWRLEKLQTEHVGDLWPELRAKFGAYSEVLDNACAAALAGRIRFQPTVGPVGDILLPYLADVKQLAWVLAARTDLDLRDNHRRAAWTNLLTVSRLATAWDVEPIEMSHLVRFACTAIAQQAVWEALQFEGWTDGQLAALQKEWESADFFNGLPDTAATSRASILATCRLARLEPLTNVVPTFGTVIRASSQDLFRSPLRAVRELIDWFGTWRRELRYRRRGSYEEEKALMVYYRNREMQIRAAISRSSWFEMRSLPGVTNTIPFVSGEQSRIGTLLNLRQIAIGFAAEGRGLISKAAEAETRRRLIVTAIALERHRRRCGSYPESLAELVPALLPRLPIDFMDGQPLRYRCDPDGWFRLYSVGLDCVDDGGQMPASQAWKRNPQGPGDLVWPRTASTDETQADLQAMRDYYRSGRWNSRYGPPIKLLRRYGLSPQRDEPEIDQERAKEPESHEEHASTIPR